MSSPLEAARPDVSARPAVDPSLAASIGDPAAPRALARQVLPPASLPGRRGAWAAARELYGQVRHGVKAFTELRARYGDAHYVRFASEPMMAVWNPDDVNAIVRNESGIWSAGLAWDAGFRRIEPSGDNLSFLQTLDFDLHRAARKVVQPAFTAPALEGYIDLATRHLDSTIVGWVAHGSVDFKPAARALLARVANAIFTGLEDPAQIAHVDALLTGSWRFAQAIIKNARFGPTYRGGQLAFARLKLFFAALLPERRKRPGLDLFSRLCQAQDAEGLSDDALIGVFIGIMAAAYDSTPAAVTSMAYLLAVNQEWQERLRAEAAAIDNQARDLAALKKLELAERVWKETLRLMPVTAIIPRRALRETTLAGHHLAAGTAVAAAAGVLGHHPKWWTNPAAFDPDRFSHERAEDKRHPALFMPFGGGAHSCVGMQVAGIEAKLLCHALLARCRFELTRPYRAEHTFTPLGCVSGQVSLTLHAL